MSAITIILASLSALALAILNLAAIDDRKRQQRLGPMKLGAMSRESFVNREECATSPWGRGPLRRSCFSSWSGSKVECGTQLGFVVTAKLRAPR